MSSKLRDYWDFLRPFYRLPEIPKITIESNDFRINQRYVPLENIRSVYYRNRYSDSDQVFPIAGASGYEILTTEGRIFFFGEHLELAELFDSYLEKCMEVKSTTLGLVRRWTKPGEPYQPVTIWDVINENFWEKLDSKQIPLRWIWISLILFGLIFLVLITWFIGKLLPM